MNRFSDEAPFLREVLMEVKTISQSAKEVLRYYWKMICGEDADMEEIERRIEKNKAYFLRHHPRRWRTYWDN